MAYDESGLGVQRGSPHTAVIQKSSRNVLESPAIKVGIVAAMAVI